MVFLKIIVHIHNIGMGIEPGHILRFRQKPHPALLEFPGCLLGEYDHLRIPRNPVYHSVRKILLHCHLLLQGLVPGPVGDSEPADSHSGAYQIPVMKNRARIQMEGFLGLLAADITAMGTDLIFPLKLIHTIQTTHH